MKNKLKFTLITILLCLFAGCSNQSDIIEPENSQSEITGSNILEQTKNSENSKNYAGYKKIASEYDSIRYYSDEIKDPERLGSSLVLQIRKDYLQSISDSDVRCEKYGYMYTLDRIWIQEYFGNYSGCEVVFMGSDLQVTAVPFLADVAGYSIVYPSSQEVNVYKDFKFYSLNEAFELGLISKKDVYEIGMQVGVNPIEARFDIEEKIYLYNKG